MNKMIKKISELIFSILLALSLVSFAVFLVENQIYYFLVSIWLLIYVFGYRILLNKEFLEEK